jgi:Tfp pilus assembly protein PilF
MRTLARVFAGRSCFDGSGFGAVCFALVLGLLSSCATTPPATDSASLFEDAAFAPQSESIDPQAVFALSPQMLEFIATDVAAEQKASGRQRGLFDALYRNGEPWLDYDATYTRNSSEAFAARSGNCLSLVLMTAAFAKQMGLSVRYQQVYTRESWSRRENLKYLNGHVNVTLVAPNVPERGGMTGPGGLRIDFIPIDESDTQHLRVLEEKTIVAMYMNNRAVELLAQGELDRAYWWAKAAIAQDRDYLGATNTLAIVYKARGLLPEAERVLRALLALEPDNIVALDNLVLVLAAEGRDAESKAVAARLKSLRPVPPFHYYDLGLEALEARDFSRAKELFLREMRRDAGYDRFHASLALADYGLGDLHGAQVQMALAVEQSTTAAERAAYARMLAHLRAGEHP